MFPSGPVDRAEKRIWGVPIVVTTQVAQDEAYLLDANSATVHIVSGEPIFVVTSDAHGEDFAHNRTRIRMEARYGVSVEATGASTSSRSPIGEEVRMPPCWHTSRWARSA